MFRCLFIAIVSLWSSCASADPIDDLIQREMATRHLPGLTFAIVKDGAVADVRSYGSADLEWKSPATNETVYAIGSITKSMTAIATLKLVERGQVSLNESVLTFAPYLPETWRAVTVQNLLSNTSGIPDNVDNPCGVPGAVYSRMADATAEVTCLPLLFAPGERFSYSNTNFLLLSILIEHVTGKPLGEVFTEIIFGPLGMSDTRIVDYRSVIPGRAEGYFWTGGAHVNVDDMDPIVEAGSGGVISTAGDMAKFITALGDTRLLAAASWNRLWTSPPVRDGTTPYALGFGVTPYDGHRRIGHNGAAPGFASSLAWFPDERVGIILLSNGYEAPHDRSVMGLANTIASGYFD